MAKDYAKHVWKTRHSAKSRNGWRLEWLWIVGLLIVIGLASYCFYLKKINTAHLASFFSHTVLHKKTKNIAQLKPQTPEKDPDSQIHFDFYTELPNMQVVPAEPADQKAAVAAKAQKEAQYVLQLGIFKDETAASQFRLSLVLAGIDAEVKPTKFKGETLFRVVHGSYSSLKLAKASQQELMKKGIASAINKL